MGLFLQSMVTRNIRLQQKVFLTDGEFESVAGEDITKVIHALHNHECARRTCEVCGGGCCKNIGCGFYSGMFEFCPIYEFRPAKCRFFFCPQILECNSLDQTIRELLDKRVKKLSDIAQPGLIEAIFADAIRGYGQKLSLTGLEVEEQARHIVEAMEEWHCGLPRMSHHVSGESLEKQVDIQPSGLDTAREHLRTLVAEYREALHGHF